jgi:hypothetical protein
MAGLTGGHISERSSQCCFLTSLELKVVVSYIQQRGMRVKEGWFPQTKTVILLPMEGERNIQDVSSRNP